MIQKLNSRKGELVKCVLLYTLIFAGMSGIIIWYFDHSGRTFVWMADEYRQHLKAMIYYSRWIRSIADNFLHGDFTIPTFSFSLGYGNDILTAFHHYGLNEPLCLLSVFVPEEQMFRFYSVLLFVRIYLSGLSFLAFYLYRRNRKAEGNALLTQDRPSAFLSVAGALTYIFSGFPVMFFYQHPHFLSTFIIFPILLIGIERAARDRKPALMILSLCLAGVCSFYFLYMTAILAILYYLVMRLPLKGDFRFKDLLWEILRLVLYGVTGVMMAGIVLLPVVASFLSDARSSSHSLFEFFYTPDYYRLFLQETVISVPPLNKNFYSAMGFGILFVPAFSMLLLKLRKNLKMLVFTLLATAGLMLPAFGYFMNGMGYVVNRWLFGFCLLAGVLVASMMEEYRKANVKETLIALGISVLYTLAAILIGPKLNVNFKWQLVLLGCFFALTLFCVFLWPRIQKRLPRLSALPVFACFAAAIAAASLLYNDYRFFRTVAKRPVSTFISEEGTREGTAFWDNDALLVSETGDRSFFRYTTNDPKRLYVNTSVLYDLSSTQYYWSMSNPQVSRFMTEMAVSDLINLYDSYHGMDDRMNLMLLSGVRYYVTKEDASAPHSYEVSETEGSGFTGLQLYRSEAALPFAFTYRNTVSSDAFYALSPIERQQILLRAAVVQNGVSLEELSEEEYGFIDEPLSLTVLETADLEQGFDSKDGALQEFLTEVHLGKASMLLRADPSQNCETYLFVSGLEFEGRNTDPSDDSWTEPNKLSFTVRFLSGETVVSEKQLVYYTAYDKWGKGQKDYLVNSGYHASSIDAIEIIFPEPGIYSFDSLSAVSLDPEPFREMTADLTLDTVGEPDLHDEKMKNVTNRIDLQVTLTESRLVVMQIPYSEGWEATVDGQKMKLEQVNIMQSGLLLEKGTHEIILQYHTPYLLPGLLVTLEGWAIFLCILLFEKRRKKTAE